MSSVNVAVTVIISGPSGKTLSPPNIELPISEIPLRSCSVRIGVRSALPVPPPALNEKIVFPPVTVSVDL